MHIATVRRATVGGAPAAPPAELVAPPTAANLIMVGGVPGAGKTTAIEAASAGLPGVSVLDPERWQRALRRRLPRWVPYRAYRAVVHTGHTLAVLAHLLLGPLPGHRLIVHDPGTRRRRRRLFLALAVRRGWRVVLVYVDAGRDDARDGQFQRGRALRAASFDRHWDRWQQVRGRLGGASSAYPEVLVDRSQATAVLRWLCLGLDSRWVAPDLEPVRAA